MLQNQLTVQHYYCVKDKQLILMDKNRINSLLTHLFRKHKKKKKGEKCYWHSMSPCVNVVSREENIEHTK